MKTIVTLSFVLFVGMATYAQDAKVNTLVAPVEMVNVSSTPKEVKWETKTEVVRLIRYRNAKVIKALNFLTKWNSNKLA